MFFDSAFPFDALSRSAESLHWAANASDGKLKTEPPVHGGANRRLDRWGAGPLIEAPLPSGNTSPPTEAKKNGSPGREYFRSQKSFKSVWLLATELFFFLIQFFPPGTEMRILLCFERGSVAVGQCVYQRYTPIAPTRLLGVGGSKESNSCSFNIEGLRTEGVLCLFGTYISSNSLHSGTFVFCWMEFWVWFFLALWHLQAFPFALPYMTPNLFSQLSPKVDLGREGIYMFCLL